MPKHHTHTMTRKTTLHILALLFTLALFASHQYLSKMADDKPTHLQQQQEDKTEDNITKDLQQQHKEEEEEEEEDKYEKLLQQLEEKEKEEQDDEEASKEALELVGAADHIVYALPPEGEEQEAYNIRTLAAVVGSEEAAKEKLMYHYKHAASGFSAMLTPKEVEQISQQPGVLQVVRSVTYQLHDGLGSSASTKLMGLI